MTLLLSPTSLPSRSAGHRLVNSVSATRIGARGGKNWRQGSASLPLAPKGDPGTQVQLPACTCFPCLLAGSLSLTRSWALIIPSSPWPMTTTPMVTPSPPGNHSLSLEAPRLHTASDLLGNHSLGLPLMTALVGSRDRRDRAFSPVPVPLPTNPTTQHPTRQKLPSTLSGHRVCQAHGEPVLGLCPLLPLFCCPPHPPDPWSLERPRFCLLSKEEGKSFGFHLQQELGRAGHVVCRVDPGTSAQRQGLQEGDRILAVNNDVVEHEDYAVVRLWSRRAC